MNALLEGLNPVQQEAVQHVERPLLIFAGAGSGKTRVITHRIAYLMAEHAVPAHQILGVTFTNKAADEMAERISGLIGFGQTPWIRTFHATCARWLREHIERLSPHYNGNFTILDQTESKGLISECIKEMGLSTDEFKPVFLASLIDRAKDHLIGPNRFGAAYADALDDYLLDVVSSVFKRYQQKLERGNSLDFADLIRLTVHLFESFPEVLETYHNRYQFMLVDEYQDTNVAQYELTRLLAEKHQNLCVVGDDDQAIFTWRGADPTNLLNFERDFPGAKVLTLGQNYRCSGNILNAANGLISNNDLRKKKDLRAVRDEGDLIHCYGAGTQDEEANFVCGEIDRLHHEYGVALNQIAILYRVNTLSRQLEDTFIRWRIPYEVVRGLRFYERLEVKDLMAYLKLLVNPHDEASLSRAINRPRRGIGAKTISTVRVVAREQQLSMWEALKRVTSDPGASSLGNAPVKKLKAFVGLMDGLREKVPTHSPSEIAHAVLTQTEYIEELERTDSAAEERIGNLREMIGQLRSFEQQEEGMDLMAFLEHTALVSDADHYDGVTERVALLTLHAAKGLEFEYVFIVGAEENLLPHSRSIREGTLEEERRLCYVGITRAKERLYLTWATQRMLYGTAMYNAPSRFLWEIPGEHLNAPLPEPPRLSLG